ncbi:hypothetical protein [Streptomyces sp. NPDC048639]|uniref:hypothetical protein n=1 Tax=Streptomyces sp. NPDC048639 TaxID=3365581 RepID=UPI003720EC29
MATVHRPTEIDASAVEIYRIDLTREEQSELRSAPEKFMRKLMERDGHTINRLLIDTRILDHECASYELVHVLSPDHRRSDHELRCVDLM